MTFISQRQRDELSQILKSSDSKFVVSKEAYDKVLEVITRKQFEKLRYCGFEVGCEFQEDIFEETV